MGLQNSLPNLKPKVSKFRRDNYLEFWEQRKFLTAYQNPPKELVNSIRYLQNIPIISYRIIYFSGGHSPFIRNMWMDIDHYLMDINSCNTPVLTLFLYKGKFSQCPRFLELQQ